MKTSYSFSILRFIYDPVSLEFVNVGIVVYSPETRQLRARCTQHYSRISRMFQAFDGIRLRQTLRFIQDRLNEIECELSGKLEFAPIGNIHEILGSVLPVDDSSLQFARGGVGLADNIDTITDQLFNRYVTKYSMAQEAQKRDDEDVWRNFKKSFDRKNVTQHLVPKKIIAKNYEYEFDRSWKNGIWHMYEPVSFDLLDASSIVEKANRWVGRAMGLEESAEPFKLFLLLGAPSDERLRAAYVKAENLLNRMPINHEFIEEAQAEQLAKEIANEMRAHNETSVVE